MRKSTLTFILAASIPLAGNAQRYFGIATSNWSGTNSVYLNPANIADSRTKFSIDLFSVNFGVDNSLGTINSKQIFSGLKDSIKPSDIINFTNNGKFSALLPYTEVRLPGFMISINHKNSIALTTRVRAFNQLNDFSQDLYRTTSNSAGQTNYDATGNKFNYTIHGWGELGLSYAGVLYEKGKHMIKGGLTARYLLGIGYAGFQSKNIDIHYTAANDNLAITNTNLQFASNGSRFNSGSDLLKNFFTGSGHGFGGDVGFVYEYRPDYAKYKYDMDGKTGITDYSKNSYLFRFSVAVTDMGAIKYTDNNRTLSITNSGTSNFKAGNIGDSVKDYATLRQFAMNHGLAVDSAVGETKVHLPTALVVGVDYHIKGGFYANLTVIGNLADRNAIGNSVYGQVTLTPRYDTRVFSVGVPITYSMLSKSLKMGIGARVGGFFIGSDDMLALFSNSQYGANFYFGASVPFNKKRPKDSDGDLVSNKKDKCPTEKGVWEMMGCPNPDKDGDGILDKDDKCPDIAGSKTAMGCPDRDLDSVADAQDRCPDQAGPTALQGCPDRDGDGIADIDDICPDVKGLLQFKGCPDTDGDGVADNEDQCPHDPGPVANHGCPDSDNDGIPDNEDRCPKVPGTRENHGCPEVSVEVKKRLAFAATAIQFETGKAIIKKASYPLLNEIVKILNDYPDYIMTIDGHTDNVGKPAKNMVLSHDRAESVKNYFVSQGISGARLITNGYGDTKPVASNKTAKGRAKNRRVAMDLKLKD